MTRAELRMRVRAAFGPGMVHATPDNVRLFLDEIAREQWQNEKPRLTAESPNRDRIEIPSEPGADYDAVIRGFFTKMLDVCAEEAAVEMWLFALDMVYSDREDHYREQLDGLFGVTVKSDLPDDLH